MNESNSAKAAPYGALNQQTQNFQAETASDGDSVESNSTPGMQDIKGAVKFINRQVLKPEVKPITGTAKTMADQAAAMMIEDMRSFLQGTEQILTAALAKAAAQALNPDPTIAATGQAALASLSTVLGDLPVFAQGIGDAATTIAYRFDNGQDYPVSSGSTDTETTLNRRFTGGQKNSVAPKSSNENEEGEDDGEDDGNGD